MFLSHMQDVTSTLTVPEVRSLELLRSIIEANEWAEFVFESEALVRIRIQGESKRWYLVVAKRAEPDPVFVSSRNSLWQFNVKGGARKRDIVHRNPYCADLCLNTHHSSQLPFGDKVAALCLSLANDIVSAMSIPLLAQFLICPREELTKILVFQDEMVVYHDMLGGPHPRPFGAPTYDHQHEFEWGDEPQEEEDEIVANGTLLGVQVDPPFTEPPPLSEEEIEEMRLWDAYEQHMEDLARQVQWGAPPEDERQPFTDLL
jgi:hypothetical protein